MTALIFLDFDGVLNSRRYYEECGLMSEEEKVTMRAMDKEDGLYGARNIDPKAVANLNRLVAETGAEIVVSSSWRLGRTVVELRAMLARRGLAPAAHVVGTTPSLELRRPGDFPFDVTARADRGLEIQSWLTAAGHDGPFVILDDDSDMAHLAHRHVRCPHETGLTDELANEAIKIITQGGF